MFAFLLASALVLGEAPIDSVLEMEDDSRAVVPLDYAELRTLTTGNVWLDTALDLALIHRGTPYLWGGDDWTKGVDCSHFTRKIFAAAGTSYVDMKTTADLAKIEHEDGLTAVPAADARPGDLLVYGYTDQIGWHGHVVVLVDSAYSYGGHTGLVAGSHGEVGVQFLTYAGFPSYFRDPKITLRRVLRVDTP